MGTYAIVIARGAQAEDIKRLFESLARGAPIAWCVLIGLVAVSDQGTDGDQSKHV